MTDSKLLISFDNFNANSEEAPCVNSPRSLEVCRQQGIKPQDLIKVSKDKLKKKYDEENFRNEQFFEKYHTHFEEKRKNRVILLTKLRKELIKDQANEQNPEAAHQAEGKETGGSQSPEKDNGVLNLLEKEQRALERMKQSQAKEIQRMIEYETKMEEMRQQNELKEQRQKERQRQHEHELEMKRQKAAEEQLAKDKEKLEKERQAEEEERRKKQELFLQEQDKLAKERVAEEERRRQIRIKEKERQLKQEEMTKQAAQEELEYQKKLAEKEELARKKEEQRKMKFDEQNAKRIFIQEEARRHHEEKIQQAKDKNEEALIKQRMDFEEEQKRVAERKAKFEREQQHQLDMIRARSLHKQGEIQKVLAMNDALEERKRQDYYEKVRLENEKKAEQDKVKKVEDTEKKAKEAAKAQKIMDVINKNDDIINTRKNEILKKQEETERKVKMTQKKLQDELDSKKNNDNLKFQDRLDNIERMKEVQEYKKAKLLQKLEDDGKRVESLKRGREEVIAVRQKLKSEIEQQKQEMLKKFYAQKKHMNKNASAASLTNPNGFLNNDSVTESKLAQTVGGN